jgi:hypothetical protein
MSDEKIVTSETGGTAHVKPPTDVLSMVLNICGMLGSTLFAGTGEILRFSGRVGERAH